MTKTERQVLHSIHESLQECIHNLVDMRSKTIDSALYTLAGIMIDELTRPTLQAYNIKTVLLDLSEEE